MIVTERRERLPTQQYATRRSSADNADSTQRQVFESCGNTRLRPDREKQFVIFSPVQRLFERRTRKHRRLFDLSRNLRCAAEPSQIERKAVAQIHRGSGVQFL